MKDDEFQLFRSWEKGRQVVFGMSNTNSARKEALSKTQNRCQDTAASHDDCRDDAQHLNVCFVVRVPASGALVSTF